ncbi:hypothetical protein HMPREF1020_03768 [Clostridium sp. 7_3_54FAA]|nr:hypothetical protein HMPREF1020_03768 [Clostridium sp. 7_3_54FAA]
MKKKRLTSLVMAAVLSAASVTPAVANTVTNNATGDEHTTIGIMEMGRSPVNVKFEVPLYVTMAAKSGDPKMVTPDGYDISNAAAPGADSYDIGVTSMKIQALGDWTIVDTGTPLQSSTEMKFSIGGCDIPAVVKAAGVKEVPLSGDFVNGDKPKAIAPGNSLSGKPEGLALKGEIKAQDRTDKKAAAQFKITYTVAALSGTGEALGSVYVGDDKTAAGLSTP